MSLNPQTDNALREIERSTAGPQTIAFFDLDGTLVSGFTVTHFTRDRIRRRELGLAELLRTIGTAIAAGSGHAEFRDLLKVAAEAWSGRRDDELNEFGERLFNRKIINLMHPGMREIVAAHQRRGHTVVLSSSATGYQVDPVARFLGIDNVICNRFEIEDEVLTGNLQEPIIWGKTKAQAAQRFAHEHGVELDQCWFYADGNEDLALMHLVGQPRPVNPRKKLARIAQKRGWPILSFTERRADQSLRYASGLFSVVPSALIGAGFALARQDRRAGVNLALPLWLDTLFGVNGVRFKLIGQQHLSDARPAVFIFNHRNQYDGFIAARVVEKDFTAVAKKELEKHWLMGGFGRLMDIAYIDRGSGKSSVEALKPIEELARKGLSVIIAPEGTRNDTTGVGAFKKGAFRMAMGVGLPIVPIVIRNAQDIAARDAGVLTPGTVDVAILPPIHTDDWTLTNLAPRMEVVRKLYERALADWPDEETVQNLTPDFRATPATGRKTPRKSAL